MPDVLPIPREPRAVEGRVMVDEITVTNGFLVVPGAVTVRAHAVLSVAFVEATTYAKPRITIRHGRSHEPLTVSCDDRPEALRTYDAIVRALTAKSRKEQP